MAEFSVVPVGTGETSVSRYVAAAIKEIRAIKELEFEVTPMGTVMAASELDTILDAVKRAHDAVASLGAARIISTLRIDDRRDKTRTMQDKVRAVNEKLRE